MYRCRYTRRNDEKTTKSSLTPYIGHIFQHINICNCILSVLNRTTSLVVPHILGTLQRDGQVYFVLTVAARCQRKRQFNVSPRPNPTNPTNTVVWPLTGEIFAAISAIRGERVISPTACGLWWKVYFHPGPPWVAQKFSNFYHYDPP